MARLLYWTLWIFLGHTLLAFRKTLGQDCGCYCTELDDSDLETLLDFKTSIVNDPNEFLSNWDSNLAPCPGNWSGVSCDIYNKVTCLNLADQQLVGSIPQSLGSLSSLESLNLFNNSFIGPIPSSLGSLTNLETLVLSFNSLSGSIPSSLGSLTNLTYLSLFLNALNGVIPASLGNLVNLKLLDLSFNQLNGSIPSSLGNLTSLTYLYLERNSLTHSIPASLGSLTDLSLLSLFNNKLNGSIPPSLGKLRSLEELHISNNTLGGSFPKLPPRLSYLDMSYNQFSGSLTSDNVIFLLGLPQGYDLTLNYFAQVEASLQDLIANVSQNCLAGGLYQRSNETCEEFCNATQKYGICGGHGSCTTESNRYSCTCDEGYAIINNSQFTCQAVPQPPRPSSPSMGSTLSPPPSSAASSTSTARFPMLGGIFAFILLVMT